MSKKFWAAHSIKGTAGPDSSKTTVPGNVIMPDANVNIPEAGNTKGLNSRAAELMNARNTASSLRRAGRSLRTSDATADSTAETSVRLAETGYQRQAQESLRRIAKGKK